MAESPQQRDPEAGGAKAPPPGTGRYPPVSPGTGGYPAVSPGTGGYPAVSPGTGGYPAVSPRSAPVGGAPESGGYPAVAPVRQHATGGYPAVDERPSGRNVVPERPTGGYPIAPGTAGYPAVEEPGTGVHESPTGVHVIPADSLQVRPVRRDPSSAGGRVPAPSDVGDKKEFRRFPRVGELIDGYNVRQVLGQGNMGRIYRVRDSMGRNQAMKVILTEIANDEGLKRFEREGQALAAIPRHKNVVQVHSMGTIRGMPYLTMDYVEGQTLEQVLKEQGPIPLKQAGIVIEKLGRALQHVHDSGILHRDLKPANIIIRNDNGEPVLTDFGLAGMRGAQSLTQTGDLLGTPLYMSPEQILGLNKDVDGRADVWGLGVLLYEMVTGSVPFPGTSMVEVCNAITNHEPLELTKLCPDADAALSAIVSCTLSKDREVRYSSPGELSRALKAWRRAVRDGHEPPPPPPMPKKKPPYLVIGVVGAAFLALGLVAATVLTKSSKRGGDGVTEEERRTAEGAPGAEGPQGELLARMRAAYAEGEPEKAALVMERPGALETLRGSEGLAALRAQVLEEGLAAAKRGEPRDLKWLPRLFVLAGALGEGLESEAPPDLANEVLKLALARQRDGDAEALLLVTKLSQARLRPEQPPALLLLDEQLYNPLDRPTYYRLLLAMVRLGVSLNEGHLAHLGWEEWGPLRPSNVPTDDCERYLRLLLEYLRTSRNNQTEAQGRVYREVEALLEASSPEALGARNYANVLGFIVRFGGANVEDPDARLERALELAPDSLELLTRSAERLLQQAQREYESDQERARALVERARERARKALQVVVEEGYDDVITCGWVCQNVRRRLVELATLLGDEAEAQRVIDGVPRNERINLRLQTEKLEAARDEARRVRQAIFGPGQGGKPGGE